MSKIHVERIRELVIRKFSAEFNKYPGVNIEYDDSPIRDVINKTLRVVALEINRCVDEILGSLDEYEYPPLYLMAPDLTEKLKKITNDFP